MIQRFLIGLISLTFVHLFTGCSTVYHQKWKRAADQELQQAPAVGRWEGTWLSAVNAHTGKLKCIITETSPDEYDFHYWARWSLFSWTYHLKLPINETDSITTFSGSKNLGKLAGGAFEFEGSIKGDEFAATYNSKFDRGEFKMSRTRD